MLLKAEHLTKIYEDEQQQGLVLKNLSLEVTQGEFVGIMGPSGAGKTTLLKILSTLMLPTSGEVFIEGKKISQQSSNALAQLRNEKLGFVFQDFNLMENLTVEDNLLLPMLLKKVPKKKRIATLTEMTARFHLADILEQFPNKISGGQKQRVATARALMNHPVLLFADEPTGSLDSKNAAILLHHFTEIHQRQKSTIVMVTHDPYTASFCQRIIFIKDGSIFAEIQKGENSQDFFQRIIEMQAVIGGKGHG